MLLGRETAPTRFSSPKLFYQEVKAEVELLRYLSADMGEFPLVVFLSLSLCLGVKSPATTRTGESIHWWNFWLDFNTFCFPV